MVYYTRRIQNLDVRAVDLFRMDWKMASSISEELLYSVWLLRCYGGNCSECGVRRHHYAIISASLSDCRPLLYN